MDNVPFIIERHREESYALYSLIQSAREWERQGMFGAAGRRWRALAAYYATFGESCAPSESLAAFCRRKAEAAERSYNPDHEPVID